ncbi:UNVERIFIED_CONTAM: hypothetical protein H355_005200 [Colinus virginianus]|nr:hypothetical protein H355_005200 [Colinus virginianus]
MSNSAPTSSFTDGSRVGTQTVLRLVHCWKIVNGSFTFFVFPLFVPTVADARVQHLREHIKQKAGEDVAQKLRLVYGGSVNEENCTQLMLQPDVDGFLVGGASLKKGFLEIISAAAKQNA